MMSVKRGQSLLSQLFVPLKGWTVKKKIIKINLS
jgi:hypothetical protein